MAKSASAAELAAQAQTYEARRSWLRQRGEPGSAAGPGLNIRNIIAVEYLRAVVGRKKVRESAAGSRISEPLHAHLDQKRPAPDTVAKSTEVLGNVLT